MDIFIQFYVQTTYFGICGYIFTNQIVNFFLEQEIRLLKSYGSILCILRCKYFLIIPR